MTRARLVTTALLILTVLAPGCAKKAAVEYANPTAFAATEYDRVFDAAVAELRDRRFAVERQDRLFGVVGTHPLIAPSALEPWRGSGSEGWTAQSTLNCDRRVVTVHLNREEGSDAMPTLGVEVRVERRRMPPSVLTSSVMAPPRLAGRGRERSYRTIRTEEGVEKPTWSFLSRDGVLEQRIIDAILRRADAARQSAS